MAAEIQWLDLIQTLLDRSHRWRPEDLAPVLSEAAGRLGIATTVYLIDYEQRQLWPLPEPGRPASEALPVDASSAGQAFSLVESVHVRTDAGDQWWSPMVNGTDRVGVIQFVVPTGTDPDATLQRRFEAVAGLVGHLITTTTPRGDRLHQERRTRPMTIGAEMLWQMLQPWTVTTNDFVVSAVLEPSYDVGGDGYDYAVDGRRPQFVILDAAGHQLRAGLACAVALAAVRATRRAGGDLRRQARAVDAALQEQFTDARFATAILAELDLDTGVLRYLNAGHPPPLLLRGGQLVRSLDGGRRLPLGIDDNEITAYGEERLLPGDRLLLHTDGVTEARDTLGEQFGTRRLVDLAEQHHVAGLPVPETLRRLSHAVTRHQHGPPADDATLMLVQWSESAAERTIPPTSRRPDDDAEPR
ncbi:MAG TPA: PP2C family protein-serine/threonine phosphatase [Actinoplanes sp.]|nr:PP2C family protein-serine/threonine phosphatase [Actinoplanes sp.]